MTKEEAIKVLDQVRQWTDYPKEAFTMAIDALSQPSLPSDLDEAALDYANKEYPDEAAVGQWGTGDYEPPVDMEYPREIAKDAFKTGVKWMAEKGVSMIITDETEWAEVDKFVHSNCDGESIIQIRKKD